ncbi:MAG: phosphoesterase [Clostridia bacterium]|nr:phosphoesterase [Clostridia bacterium]
MEFFADLHIHSCLSPCGDNDMTPANILGMAVVKGLDMVAISDHNAARNLPTAQKVADAYGLLLIPAMEITTKEEVHMLGYFPSVEAAVEFDDMLREHLPAQKNKPSLFGEQLIMDEDDNVIGEEDALLIGATNLPLKEAAARVRSFGGVPVPAHINRGSNGMLVNLGMMPDEPFFPTVEVWRHLPCPFEPLENRHVLHSSDAHYLGDILEKESVLHLPEKSVQAFLKWIDSPK